MPTVLLLLGVLTAAVGAVMIGVGVPINEFSLGNTLIIAGTTAFVGGLVIVSLSVAVRLLSRINDLLKTRPVVAPTRPTGFEPAPPPPAGPGRLSFPPRGENREFPRGHDPRMAEPDVPHDPIFDRLRMEHMAARRGNAEPPLVEEDVEASLSPRAPVRIPGAAPAPQPEPVLESRGPKVPRPDAEHGRNGSTEPSRAASPESLSDFEDAWPTPTVPQTPPRAQRADAADPFASDLPPLSRDHPAPPRDSARDMPKARDIPAASPARTNGASHRPDERAPQGAVSILKSGVVDGMAYTLYTDGSIEAELAQGVVRFGSIEELRHHLEKEG
jgi:hypothetical protein